MAAPQPVPGSSPVQHRNPYVTFAIANLIAAAIGAVIFLFFLRADFLDGAFGAFGDFLFEYAGLAVLAAVSPVMAGLLVGMGYARRGKARRAAEALAVAQAEARAAALASEA